MLEKDKYHLLLLICEIKKKKELIETKRMGVLWEHTESRMVVAKDWEMVKMWR